jgi:E3 ubiquitin-protein ligase HERC3
VCAVLVDGRLQCWGHNSNGQLGVGDSTDHTAPTAAGDVGTGHTVTDVVAGNYFTCALLDNLMVKCWGANFAGSLGLGDVINRGDAPGTMGDNLPTVSLW